MDSLDFTQSYVQKQCERIDKSRNRIGARSTPIRGGRVIPSDGDLSIGTGRRLNASVMFLDICKFSSRPSETKTEQAIMLQLLTFFFSEMIHIVEDYGGFVEKNTGDGLMAYFVESSVQGSTAQHTAVAAALTMFSASDWFLNPVIQNSDLQPLDFRICIDHGNITVAEVGVAKRFGGMVAIGTTANVANKMLATADPNSILLGANVIKGLPPYWNSLFVKLKSSNTGWVLKETGLPYFFYEFTGRRRNPEL